MRLHLKKQLVLSSLIIVSSITSQAHAIPSTNPNQPMMSGYYDPTSMFSVTLGLKYQSYSDNGTIFASSFNSTPYTSSSRDFLVHQDYHLGYILGLNMALPYPGSSLRLDYSVLNSSDSSSVTGNNLYIDGDGVRDATGKSEFSTDIFNFTYRQTSQITSILTLNYIAGINYSHLSKDMTTTATETNFNSWRIEGGTDFKGIGPVIGLEGMLHPFPALPDFGFVGSVQGLFPYGKMTGYFREFEGIDDSFNKDIPSEKLVVPGLNSKLGIYYNFKTSKLGWQAGLGYETSTFFDATKTADYNGNSTNMSYQGAYFTLTAGSPTF